MYKECENKNGTGATTIAKNESFFFFFFFFSYGGGGKGKPWVINTKIPGVSIRILCNNFE